MPQSTKDLGNNVALGGSNEKISVEKMVHRSH